MREGARADIIPDMMERTELREEFFKLIREDPYLAVVERTWARAWVDGYEQALRDVVVLVDPPREAHEIEEFSYSKTYGERLEDARAFLTDTRSRAEEIVALAMLGSKMEKMASDVIQRLLDPKRFEVRP